MDTMRKRHDQKIYVQQSANIAVLVCRAKRFTIKKIELLHTRALLLLFYR